MCGIVGIVDKNNSNNELVEKMANIFKYRGPDDYGEYIDKENGVALAMRRLSIIDLGSGHQPMFNEDNSISVVCNGEIYNSPELRDRLIKKGHHFNTRNSDVEVLLHLYEDEGSNLLKYLNGMYAFVIYDKKKNILFGARDRIGIKPFYFSQKNGKFAFSSELKSLLLLPWVLKEINNNSLYHYLSLQFVPAPETIFEDVQKLSAGSFFLYDIKSERCIIEKYWDVNLTVVDNRTLDDWTDIIKLKIEEAVKLWTLSDVPIACSLSGGIDSSILVGILAKTGMMDIRTYSLGFESSDEQQYSEIGLARQIANRWGTKHHEVILKPERLLNDLEKMVWHLDEPYGGGLPSWYIYEIIGKDVKVALTGTGGDELFSNYGKYEIYEKLWVYRNLKSLKESIKYRNIKEYFNYLLYPKGHFFHRYMSDAFKDNIVLNGNAYYRTESLIENIWKESNTNSFRNAVAYIDFRLQLPEEFLSMTDRFSMAHSVEARTPFLEHTLVELVYKMPPNMRTGGKVHKGFMKMMFKDIILEEVSNAPKKGFILPLTQWTRRNIKPMVEQFLGVSFLQKQGIFNKKMYEKIVKPHLEGRMDYTQQVWTLLMFQLWYEKYIVQSVN